MVGLGPPELVLTDRAGAVLGLVVFLQGGLGLHHLATCGALEVVGRLYMILQHMFLIEGVATFLTAKHVDGLNVGVQKLLCCQNQPTFALERMQALSVDFQGLFACADKTAVWAVDLVTLHVL